MRKVASVAAVLSMTTAFAGQAVAGSDSRARTKPYNAMTLDADGARGTMGEVTFATREGERWVRVKITDATGQPIAFDVDQGKADSVEVDGCGTSSRLPIRGGRPVTVSILVNVEGDSGCPTGTGTQGTVEATFGL